MNQVSGHFSQYHDPKWNLRDISCSAFSKKPRPILFALPLGLSLALESSLADHNYLFVWNMHTYLSVTSVTSPWYVKPGFPAMWAFFSLNCKSFVMKVWLVRNGKLHRCVNFCEVEQSRANRRRSKSNCGKWRLNLHILWLLLFFCIIVYKENGLKYYKIKKNSDFCFPELFLVEQVIFYLYHPCQNWDKF